MSIQTEDIRKSIGAQLIAARTEKGMSQNQVAKATGLVQSYIVRMERGQIAPNIATLTKYLDAIGGYEVAIVKK